MKVRKPQDPAKYIRARVQGYSPRQAARRAGGAINATPLERTDPSLTLIISTAIEESKRQAALAVPKGVETVGRIAAMEVEGATCDNSISATKLLLQTVGALTETVQVQVSHSIPYRSLLDPDLILHRDTTPPSLEAPVARRETLPPGEKETTTLPLGRLPLDQISTTPPRVESPASPPGDVE